MTDAKIASRTPYLVEVEAGKTYWWCACGRSDNQPFCDGSHNGTEINPVEYKANENTNVWFCGCKRSMKRPICDGTHSKL